MKTGAAQASGCESGNRGRAKWFGCAAGRRPQMFGANKGIAKRSQFADQPFLCPVAASGDKDELDVYPGPVPPTIVLKTIGRAAAAAAKPAQS